MRALLLLPPWLVVVGVAALPALEASTLAGLVVPGETAVLAGGVLAHSGIVPIWLVVAAAVGGAVVGDQVGYTLGRRYGPSLLDRLPARARQSGALDRSILLVRRRGATAVLAGRWVAALRALVPGLAGLSGISRTRFTVANVIGGAGWATAVALAGYLAGASYTVLDERFGMASDIVLGVVVLAVAASLVRGRLPRGGKGRLRPR